MIKSLKKVIKSIKFKRCKAEELQVNIHIFATDEEVY